jgi:hypothetical protein
MKPKPRGPEQDGLLRSRLTDMIDMRHEPVKLAALIDWEFFEAEWAGFAETIFEMAELAVAVERIPTTEYPLPAPRPLNSRLDCSRTEAVFGIPRPDWRAGLAEILKDLSRQGDTS